MNLDALRIYAHALRETGQNNIPLQAAQLNYPSISESEIVAIFAQEGYVWNGSHFIINPLNQSIGFAQVVSSGSVPVMPTPPTPSVTPRLKEEKKVKQVTDKVALDSVVLPQEKKEQINAAISQIKNEKLIFETWGFGDVFEKGTAITLLFYGTPGCLAADTIVEINRGGKSFPIRLDDLVHRFNGGTIDRGNLGKTTWDLAVPTKIRSYVDGYIRLVELKAALVSGKKKTYVIETASNRSIRATEDHPFLTTNGWKKLKELKKGDKIICEGDSYFGTGRTKKIYQEVGNLIHHPYAKSRGRVAVHRLVYEASLSNLKYGEYIQRLRENKLEGLVFVQPSYAVHHIDGNHKNNKLENLKMLTHIEHWELEGKNKNWRNVFMPVSSDKIITIGEYGEEETFDLTVEGNDPNFLANGLIVHNTGKTLAAQAIADEQGAELKIYGMAEIGSSEPGGSERTIKKIFQEAKELFLGKEKKQRVILFDECDSLLYDRNKVGVILGAQINAMLTEIERHEGIVIFTTNRIGTLDPALERRITAKIEFPFPDQKARLAIWTRMIPGKAPLAKNVSLKKLAVYPLAGGNIKNAVLNAVRMAAYENGQEISMKHFVDAIEKEAASIKAFDKGDGWDDSPHQSSSHDDLGTDVSEGGQRISINTKIKPRYRTKRISK